MRSRPLAALLLFAGLLSAARGRSAAPAAAGSSPRARSVVLISIDSLRADHLSFYGYPRVTMPRLATRLARRGGTVFRNATAVSPSCHPSHTAMLTGLYPQEVGVPWCGEDLIVKWSDFAEPAGVQELEGYQAELRAQPPALRLKRLSAVRNWLTIPREQETLEGLLRARGFFTVGAVSIWTVTSRFGYASGFDRYVDAMPEYYGPRSLTWLLRDTMQSQRRQLASATIDAAIQAVSGLDAARPFFLFVNLADTHVPYTARGERHWSGSPSEGSEVEAAWKRRYPAQGWEKARRAMSGPEGFLLDRYDDAIRSVDLQIDRLLEALAARGRLDETLLVVTSDHGDSFGQHPYLASTPSRRLFFEHSLYVWEETQHVPLLVSWPGGDAGLRFRDVNVSQVDLKPTVLAALGLEGLGEGGPGEDLERLPEAPRAVYFLTFGRGQPGLLSQARLDYPRFIGMRIGSLKFFVDRERFRDPKAGRCYLFDLATDPDELHDLCASQPARAARMRATLVDWYRQSTSGRAEPRSARR